MKEVFEYRRTPSRGVIWLSASAFAMLIAAITLTDAQELTWLVWALGPITLYWMLRPKPVAGMRIDDVHLVLFAWRQPREIPLDDIAYLRVIEADIAIVYKNGTQENVFLGDMPDIKTLIEVMAARGIAVRNVD